MITARNLVHGVMFMVGHFGAVAVLFLLLEAPFLAAVQVAVYAGAIMVLFLFVVMLIGQREITLEERLVGQRWLAVLGAVALLVGLLSVVAVDELTGRAAVVPEGLAANNPQRLGELLFTKYFFPFEIVSVLLLVAMIGAVVLARREAFLRRVVAEEEEAAAEAVAEERAQAA
jgi:NADH-quinone oxidoreductase subunit J